MKSLVWFRSDLRLNDNPALKEACANYSEVHAIYVYSPQQLSEHNESNVKIDFLIQNLIHLENNLNELKLFLLLASIVRLSCIIIIHKRPLHQTHFVKLQCD